MCPLLCGVQKKILLVLEDSLLANSPTILANANTEGDIFFGEEIL